MNSDNIILRQNNYPPLTNKGAVLDSNDFDNNFINVYKDLEALKETEGVEAYNAGTTYDDSVVQFTTYLGRFWKWVNGSPGAGVTPVNGVYWQEAFPTVMAHRKNSDTILDEGGANEISAAAIVAALALGDSTTDLSITSKTPTSLQLNSSTGTDVVFLEATQDVAGLLSAADKVKLVNTSGFNTGDQTLGELGGESVENKALNFSTINHTLYPSVEAVDTHIQSFSNAKLDQTLGVNTTVELSTFDLDFVNGNIIINSAYTLPNVDGTAGQTIQTNGAGVLSWEDAPANTNLSNTDIVLDRAVGKITLNGSLLGDTLSIDDAAGLSITKYTGNHTITHGVTGAGNGGVDSITQNLTNLAVLDTEAHKFVTASTSFGAYMGLSFEHTVRTGYGYISNNGGGSYSRMKFTGGTTKAGAKISAYIEHSNIDQAGHWLFRNQIHLGNAIRLPQSTYGVQTLVIENGTAPTATPTDGFVHYAGDIVAGNSAPHFRTENGDILKLYKNTALTASDGTLATAITRQAEIETILTNLGII
jgi:hypothetical protein